ncbi:hypothetical protein Fmac_002432 [Flemingia macrophylla]|uniref:Uncharacterized protein n=1 Tax=Flemingia macrophylla TaxID=520843 RepID=A0ABD1NJW8_9FABA
MLVFLCGVGFKVYNIFLLPLSRLVICLYYIAFVLQPKYEILSDDTMKALLLKFRFETIFHFLIVFYSFFNTEVLDEKAAATQALGVFAQHTNIPAFA